MNKIIKYIGASAVICLMAGCTTNFEDFNTNPYQPSKVLKLIHCCRECLMYMQHLCKMTVSI